MNKKCLFLSVLSFSALLITGCNEGTDTSSTTPEPPASSSIPAPSTSSGYVKKTMTIDPTAMTVVVGNTITLVAKENGNPVAGVTWTSLSPSIATVNQTSGVVTGEEPGTATIKASKVGYVDATITITVTETPITEHSYYGVFNNGTPTLLTKGVALDGTTEEWSSQDITFTSSQTYKIQNEKSEKITFILGTPTEHLTYNDGILTAVDDCVFVFYYQPVSTTLYLLDKTPEVEHSYYGVFNNGTPTLLTKGVALDGTTEEWSSASIDFETGNTYKIQNEKGTKIVFTLGSETTKLTNSEGVLTATENCTFVFYYQPVANTLYLKDESPLGAPKLNVKLGASDWTLKDMTPTSSKVTANEYSIDLNFTAGDLFSIKLKDDVWYNFNHVKNDDGSKDIVEKNSDNDDIKFKSTGNYTVFVDYDSNDLSKANISVISSDMPAETDRIFKCFNSSGDPVAKYDIAAIKKDRSNTEYVIYDYSIALENVDYGYKFVWYGNWLGFDNVKDGCKDLVESLTDNRNIKFKQTGIYDIYIDTTDTGSTAKCIWIEKCPVIKGIGGDWVGGVPMDKAANEVNEYQKLNLEFSANEAWKVDIGLDWLGFGSVKDECKGLVNDSGEPDHNIVMKDGGHYNIYVAKTGEQRIWIEKVVNPS